MRNITSSTASDIKSKPKDEMPQPISIAEMLPMINNAAQPISKPELSTGSTPASVGGRIDPCQAIVKRYGNSAQLLAIFNPAKQLEYTRDESRVYGGKAPAIALVGKTYGPAVAEVWLEIQLNDLSEFSGCKGKITDNQMAETAAIIRQTYGYMNMAEIMLFFQKMKRGEYGKFYGSVDPMTILSAMVEFAQERLAAVKKLQEAKEDKERAAHAALYETEKQSVAARLMRLGFEANAISYPEYCMNGCHHMDDKSLDAWIRARNDGMCADESA